MTLFELTGSPKLLGMARLARHPHHAIHSPYHRWHIYITRQVKTDSHNQLPMLTRLLSEHDASKMGDECLNSDGPELDFIAEGLSSINLFSTFFPEGWSSFKLLGGW